MIASVHGSLSSSSDIDDDKRNTPGDSGEMPSTQSTENLGIDSQSSTSFSVPQAPAQEEPGNPPEVTPLVTSRLDALLSEYDKLANGLAESCKRHGSPDKDNESPYSSHLEPIRQLPTRL
ncbi:hypothetical protein VFPPC_14793 [Pochonia chlamydosporia 170]|uniref:Uncharacterized protein n=1 Tax=Pochonia chlamydosporia 170 TaxID=1380566 RepID=A0A179F423_METCM|nr:hypothetical protein VFPPC_14793 [Pochonia chlamydosporia 170]OAQ60168.1 hypothetical protein VFPPC_14793 [Pochonia chlamydosporia 170]